MVIWVSLGHWAPTAPCQSCHREPDDPGADSASLPFLPALQTPKSRGSGARLGESLAGDFPTNSLKTHAISGSRSVSSSAEWVLSKLSFSSETVMPSESAGPLRAWERCPLGGVGWRRQAAGPKVLPRPSPGEGAVQGLKTHASWGSPCLPSRSIPLEKESSNPFKPQYLITPQTFSASSVAAAGT